MTFDAYFRFTSYALIATAFAGLALTGELDAASIVLYPIALALSAYVEARGGNYPAVRRWQWRAMVAIYVPVFLIDAKLLTNWTLALVHLTLLVAAAKLLQAKRDRDWVFLFLIAVFQMLLAAGLTFNASFAASLAVFIFFFVSTLAAFEIRRAGREVAAMSQEEIVSLSAKPKRPKRGGVRQIRYFVGASAGQVFIVAALTLPLFFLIPRGSGGVARGFGDTYSMTGFSTTVRLGEVVSIKESQRVVMRVQLSRKPGRMLRWHGISLDKYDGTTWSNTFPPFDQDQHRRTGAEGWQDDASFEKSYPLGPGATEDAQGLVAQKMFVEPLASGTIFGAQRLVRVRGPIAKVSVRGAGEAGFGFRDLTAVTAAGLKGRVQYTVWSDIALPTEEQLRAEPTKTPRENVDDENLKKYVELPRGRYGEIRLDPRIRLLAREQTRGLANAYDKARAIETFLKTRFGYTLNPQATGDDPLAAFLFDVREGHCEYFATAMTIMLRTLDIPCRIANGFQMGEHNEINNLYVVRGRDAHSWVEVYFPAADAWVEFDPTPAAGINDYSQGGFFARLRKYIDAAEVFWLDYIVTLDRDEQASILVEMQQKMVTVKERLRTAYLDVKRRVNDILASILAARRWDADELLKLIGGLALLIVAGFAAYVGVSYFKQRGAERTGYGPWWRRILILAFRWRRGLVRGDARKSAVLFYEQMLAIAARRGLIKEPHQTPVEFAAASGFDQIREITAVYNRVRFGGIRLDDEEALRVSELLRELRGTVGGSRKTRRSKRSSHTA
ncbi:MAG TPA: DUF3488 and transglutaminase-like domain-containing protein [Blastocatellia bacterium]|nr:DUF3488 and transglutaminase-like domain-containing protein [Blastocatellia bacterium]